MALARWLGGRVGPAGFTGSLGQGGFCLVIGWVSLGVDVLCDGGRHVQCSVSTRLSAPSVGGPSGSQSLLPGQSRAVHSSRRLETLRLPIHGVRLTASEGCGRTCRTMSAAPAGRLRCPRRGHLTLGCQKCRYALRAVRARTPQVRDTAVTTHVHIIVMKWDDPCSSGCRRGDMKIFGHITVIAVGCCINYSLLLDFIGRRPLQHQLLHYGSLTKHLICHHIYRKAQPTLRKYPGDRTSTSHLTTSAA